MIPGFRPFSWRLGAILAIVAAVTMATATAGATAVEPGPLPPGGTIAAGKGPPPPANAAPGLNAPPAGAPPAAPAAPVATAAVLRGLNKITGRVTTIVAPINQPVRFGALQIVAHTCVQRPPTEPPDDIAFLSIDDVKPDGKMDRIFTGWMFKSSPSLSALQNPVYDVWVQGCQFGPAATK